MARNRKQPISQQEFKCPECGRTFSRAAALGAHRRQAHGVVGTSSSASSATRRTRRTTSRARATRTRTSSASGRRSNSPRARGTASNDGRRRTRTPDRDALLKALFPNGIPPREDVIRAVNSWLDDAERLARMA